MTEVQGLIRIRTSELDHDAFAAWRTLAIAWVSGGIEEKVDVVLVLDLEVKKALDDVVVLDFGYFPLEILPDVLSDLLGLLARHAGQGEGNDGVFARELLTGGLQGYFLRTGVHGVQRLQGVADFGLDQLG